MALGQLYPVNILAQKETKSVPIKPLQADLKKPPALELLDLKTSFMRLRSPIYAGQRWIQGGEPIPSVHLTNQTILQRPIDYAFAGLSLDSRNGISSDRYVQSMVRLGLTSNSMQYFVLVGSQWPNPFSLNSLSQQNVYTSLGLGVHYAFNDSWSAELGAMVYLPHTNTPSAGSLSLEDPSKAADSLSSFSDVQDQVRKMSKTGMFSFSETFFRVVYYFCKE